MAHWRIKKAKYPIDHSRAWMAIPGNSIMRAHRFATWREAQDFVATRENRKLAKQQKRIDRDQGIRP